VSESELAEESLRSVLARREASRAELRLRRESRALLLPPPREGLLAWETVCGAWLLWGAEGGKDTEDMESGSEMLGEARGTMSGPSGGR